MPSELMARELSAALAMLFGARITKRTNTHYGQRHVTEYIKIPNVSEPPFETDSELIDTWGRNWGCDSDVGKLKTVLMHPPTERYSQGPWKGISCKY